MKKFLAKKMAGLMAAKGPSTLAEAFPLPYETWYAAALFLDAGHPREEILRRVGLDDQRWESCDKLYSHLDENTPLGYELLISDMLEGSLMYRVALTRRSIAGAMPEPTAPTEPPKLPSLQEFYAHLTAGGSIEFPAPTDSFDLRSQLEALRRKVEADPHIGPFTDVDWVAHYIGEKRYPMTRYVHDGHYVRANVRSMQGQGKPLWARQGEPIEGIDPWMFRILSGHWFRDGKRVYGLWGGAKIFWYVARDADPDSFEVLNDYYARDKAAGYYYTDRRFPTAEPGTFEIIGYHYGRGEKPGFHIDTSSYAKDSQKIYGYGKVIKGADASSFHSIGDEGRFFADANHIYFETTPIEGADRASFTCCSEAGQFLAFDKNHPYWMSIPQPIAESFEKWKPFFDKHPELADTWWHKERNRRAGITSEYKSRRR